MKAGIEANLEHSLNVRSSFEAKPRKVHQIQPVIRTTVSEDVTDPALPPSLPRFPKITVVLQVSGKSRQTSKKCKTIHIVTRLVS